MRSEEFAIWAILVIFTLFFLFNWVLKKRTLRDATPFEKRERIALRAAPWVAIGWAAALVLFLFVQLNKLYLLAIFPLVYIFVNYQVASHITKNE